MKVLITGATGFVGGALLKHLRGVRPVRIALRDPNAVNILNDLEVVRASLTDKQDWLPAISGVSVVVHCAARVHVMREISKDPLAEFRSLNVQGTLNLAVQAARSGVRRFVFISSVKVNGETTDSRQPFTADEAAAPLDPYGISKMEAEQALRELSIQTGMEVVIIRPPLVYGPGVKANFASMMQWLKLGIPLPLGGITANLRSLVYIENLVDLIGICVDHPKAANQIFMVSDGEDVSTTSLLRSMGKALGRTTRLINLSPSLIKLSASFIGKPEIADRLCGSLQVDITKTKELLGWKPKFSLDEGLRQTAMSLVNGLYK